MAFNGDWACAMAVVRAFVADPDLIMCRKQPGIGAGFLLRPHLRATIVVLWACPLVDPLHFDPDV